MERLEKAHIALSNELVIINGKIQKAKATEVRATVKRNEEACGCNK